jgi:hypothetical protein
LEKYDLKNSHLNPSFNSYDTKKETILLGFHRQPAPVAVYSISMLQITAYPKRIRWLFIEGYFKGALKVMRLIAFVHIAETLSLDV